MNNKRIIQTLVVLALPLAMAACAQEDHMGSVDELNKLNASTPTGSSFSQKLSKDYLDMAETNKSEYNWPVMSLWAHKGMKADEGVAVAPEVASDWSYASLQLGGVNGTFFTPDSAAVPALNEARGRLVNMLGSDAPNRFPDWAATAQTKYDCWLESTHEAWEERTIVGCRKGFEDAMLLIYAPAKHAEAAPVPAPAAAVATMMQTSYLVFFDFDKSDLKPEARKIIASAVQAANSGSGTKIAITGFTDTMGTNPYNFKLSYRRGDAVEQELIRDGIPAGSIGVDGKGKNDLLVQTADEVREPQNRRATIQLIVQ